MWKWLCMKVIDFKFTIYFKYTVDRIEYRRPIAQLVEHLIRDSGAGFKFWYGLSLFHPSDYIWRHDGSLQLKGCNSCQWKKTWRNIFEGDLCDSRYNDMHPCKIIILNKVDVYKICLPKRSGQVFHHLLTKINNYFQIIP